MSTLVIVLRIVSLLALAGPMLLAVTGRCGGPKREHVRVAEQFAKDNGAISYNVGLLYFELGDYERSMSFAKDAYDLGLNLPGLRQKLTKAGKWKE